MVGLIAGQVTFQAERLNMSTQVIKRYSPEEYLELERKAEYKSEFLNGQIYAMAGASPIHSVITVNLSGEVYVQLRGSKCQAYSNDTKVRTSPAGLYSYPDLSVVCGEPKFQDEQKDVLINPKVIFEVLSPTTEAFDRGAKFLRYQTIEAFTDYVLIAQDEARVEHLSRQADGGWLLYIIRGLEKSFRIASIDCTISLAGIYDRVTFPDQEPE
jgi:Uma2 family endonuclease